METRKTLLEAIALQKCVEATYNRLRMRLAPHILYTRHDELFVDAVTLEREGQPPRELKLGVFKLSGLNNVQLVPQPFSPEQALFDPASERYDGVTVFAVEPA